MLNMFFLLRVMFVMPKPNCIDLSSLKKKLNEKIATKYLPIE